MAIPVYYPGGCGVIPNPKCTDCVPVEEGRIRAVFLQNVDYTWTDITNPVEWETAIMNNSVYLFSKVKGSLASAPQLSDSYGNIPQQVDAYTITLDLSIPLSGSTTDPFNLDFWNTIVRSNQFLVGYCTQTYGFVSSQPAMFTPNINVADDLKTRVDLKLQVSFLQSLTPTTFVYPQALFLGPCIEE